MISAGTISDLNLLDANRANYLAGVFQFKKAYGLAYIDLTTGDFRLTEFQDRAALQDEIHRIAPSELLYSEEQESLADLPGGIAYDGYAFLYDQAYHSQTRPRAHVAARSNGQLRTHRHGKPTKPRSR